MCWLGVVWCGVVWCDLQALRWGLPALMEGAWVGLSACGMCREVCAWLSLGGRACWGKGVGCQCLEAGGMCWMEEAAEAMPFLLWLEKSSKGWCIELMVGLDWLLG